MKTPPHPPPPPPSMEYLDFFRLQLKLLNRPTNPPKNSYTSASTNKLCLPYEKYHPLGNADLDLFQLQLKPLNVPADPPTNSYMSASKAHGPRKSYVFQLQLKLLKTPLTDPPTDSFTSASTNKLCLPYEMQTGHANLHVFQLKLKLLDTPSLIHLQTRSAVPAPTNFADFMNSTVPLGCVGA